MSKKPSAEVGPTSPLNEFSGAKHAKEAEKRDSHAKAAEWRDTHNSSGAVTVAHVDMGRQGYPRLWVMSPDHPVHFATGSDDAIQDASNEA